jgi:hypothetical protein
LYEIAIINPRPRKRKTAGKRRRKSGAKVMAKRRKKRASAKVTKRRVKRRAARASAPKRRRRRATGAKRAAVGYVQGPKRIRRRKMNPRRRASRRHSNPRFSVSGITSQLVPAAYGAAGAVALDIALGYIPLPAMLTTGYAKHATRIVGALGIGWLAGKFLRGKSQAIGSGALTVAVYGLMKDVLVQFAPNVKGLGDYEEISVNGYDDPAGTINAGVGAYLGGSSADTYFGDGSLDVDGVGAYMAGVDY